ncbi:MAG TPA: tetratricopeptide repeat protein [Terriglobales bacterium]|nr:tetratricopeptide repeat protein [Terriglobales bacterium]
MIKRIYLPLIAVLALMLLSSQPALAVSKEMVQLQTQVQGLQDQMARMQQSFDERMGVMKNLIDQSTDNMNRMTTAVDALQKSLQQQNADTAGKVDQVSGQVQALHDSLDELKARLAQVSKKLDDMTAAQQNLPAGSQPGAPGQPPQAQNQVPAPDALYNNALRDYNAAKYPLAAQEFSDYLKYYGSTELAGNAQFYIAEIEYRQGNYAQAVKDYDTVLEQYPGGNKSAAAQLKKGFALLETGDRQAGVRELHSLVNRYPRSPEAAQARDRLRRLVSASAKPSPETR